MRGLAQARGDVLALTDDDVLVANDWLAAVRRVMADGSVALAGGRIDPRWERPAPSWLRLDGPPGPHGPVTSTLALLHYAETCEPLDGRAALGANMAVRRTALDGLGGFARHLGKLRGTLLSGEDHELCRRVEAAGLRTLYVPSMRVRHWIPADRLTIRYCLRWFFWSGITHAVLDRGNETGTDLRRLLGVPRYLFREAAAAAGGCARSLARGCPADVVQHATTVAVVLGYLRASWQPSPAERPAPEPADVLAAGPTMLPGRRPRLSAGARSRARGEPL
jgi:hypothetical protein